MSSLTNQEPKALGKWENVRDFIVCVLVVLHGIMKCLVLDYYVVLLHINIYNITLINKVVYIQTKYLNWREVYNGFLCKGLEEYQFHFLPPRNPRVSETIHTQSKGRVLVPQGGLWKAYLLYTANKFLLKVSWSLLVSKSDSSFRSDWYAAANDWLCPTRLGLCVNQCLRNKVACIQMI